MKYLKTYEELEFTKLSEYEDHPQFLKGKFSSLLNPRYYNYTNKGEYKNENWEESKKLAKRIYDEFGKDAQIDKLPIIKHTIYRTNDDIIKDQKGFIDMFEYLIELGFDFSKTNILQEILSIAYTSRVYANLYIKLFLYFNKNIDDIDFSNDNIYRHIINTYLFQDEFLIKNPERFRELKVRSDIKKKYSYIFDGNKMGLI